MSNGLGVESVAILLRWLEDPTTRDFPLEELTVITAMTGKEWPDTKRDFETHILPRLRDRGIRFVQVARAGHLEQDGIVVLDDSRKAEKLYIEGAYTLTQELMTAGTVPQFGAEHRCSLKFKAFVIETWLRENLPDSIRHTFGYNAEELERIAKSDRAIARVTFGFNSDEGERVARGKAYDGPVRIGHYPLPEWGWNRQRCLDYILSVTGVHWKKSACVYCPFARITPELIARQKEFPEDVADSMLLERVSLAMNPRGQLYSRAPLYQIVSQSGNQEAIKIFDERMNSTLWALYRVRRIYHPKPIYEGEGEGKRIVSHDHSKKGTVQRCVESLGEALTREAACDQLRAIAERQGTQLVRRHDLSYVSIKDRGNRYPSIEDYFVAAPSVVETKARYGVAKFEEDWMHAADLYCGHHDDLPLFAAVE
jgi:hypothetical protein